SAVTSCWYCARLSAIGLPPSSCSPPTTSPQPHISAAPTLRTVDHVDVIADRRACPGDLDVVAGPGRDRPAHRDHRDRAGAAVAAREVGDRHRELLSVG